VLESKAAHTGVKQLANDDRQSTQPGKVLFLLLLANLLNFFDRSLPAVVAEPIRLEFGLSDLQLGLLSTVFVVVYAIAGLPLGRLADTKSRRTVLVWGLVVWSLFTGFGGLAWSFVSLLIIRIGVGIGEACYAPVANSLIADMYPSARRARAVGIYMLGLPLGLMLAFFAVGPIVQMFESWRAPFLLAALPGLALAWFLARLPEPQRGESDGVAASTAPVTQPFRSLLRIRTLWWVVASGLTINFAAYPTSGFLVPLLQRHFELSLSYAASLTGIVVGVTGLIGLTVGGTLADRMHHRGDSGRLVFGALMLLLSAVLVFAALWFGATSISVFVSLFALGWLGYYTYFTSVYPAIHDVVEPRLRATAMALYFAAMYLLGGATGPIVVGALSDHLALSAMQAAGAPAMTEAFKSVGLYQAMYLVPVMLFFTAFFIYGASRSYGRDRQN